MLHARANGETFVSATMCHRLPGPFRDKKSHIFKHLSASKGSRDKCDNSSFKIERLKPELNEQVGRASLSLHF